MKLNKATIMLAAVALAFGIACGDDDENNNSNNMSTSANNTSTGANNTSTGANNTSTGANNTSTGANNTSTGANNTTPGPTARLQVIHNSPDPAAATVDVYVNDDLYIDDFAFRTGTGFVEVPAGEELVIDVATPDSTSSDDRLNEEGAFAYTLEADSYTTLIASGVLDPSTFADNPSGEDTSFTLLAVNDQKTTPADDSTIEVKVVHGAPDAPTVDAVTPDGNSIVDDASYGDVTSYLPIPGGNVVTLDITTADNTSRLASYQTTGGVQGVTATALASGFLDPSGNNDGEAFGLFVFLGVDADMPTTSDAIALPQAARVQLAHNAADPAANMVDVFINGTLAVNDFTFRTASPFVTLPSGAGNVTVDVAGSAAGDNIGDGLDPQDSRFQATPEFEPGSTNTVFANGVLDPSMFEGDAQDIAFGLFAVESQESPETIGNFEFKAFHGSTDAPTVDISVGGDTANPLVDNLMYGMASAEYVSRAGNTNTSVEVNTEDGSVTLNQYDLDVAGSGLADSTGIVAASGFRTPANDQSGPSFGLIFFPAQGGAGIALPSAGN